MANTDTLRLQTGTGHISVRMSQPYKTVEALSLKVYQLGEYPSDTSDFGVLIGRVTCKGVGIPNVRVSVFIPLDDADANNPNVAGLYPFKQVTDIDYFGNRYNLLPKYRTCPPSNISTGSDPYSEGFGSNPYGVGYRPDKALGSFPTQEEVCANDLSEYIYSKYYRLTAITNDSGDYMIMGVPVGTHTVHYDCDLTDIGDYSMKPIVLSKLLGYPSDLFEANGTKIRENTTLDDAKHIIFGRQTVDISPYWGNPDGDAPILGLTRQDFALNVEIVPTTTIFFAGMTMPKDSYWYDWVSFRIAFGPIRLLGIPIFPVFTGDFSSNPCSVNGGKNNIDPFVLQFKNTIKIGDAFDFNKTPDFFSGEPTDKLDLSRHRAGRFSNTLLDYRIADEPEILGAGKYISIEQDGSCAYIVPCNRRKVATNDEGLLVEVPDDAVGLYTEFDGAIISRMEGEIDRPTTKVLTDRVFLKIPQWSNYDDNPSDWISRKYTFKANRYYSVVQRWWSKNNSTGDFSNTGMVCNLLDKDDDNTANPDFSNYKLDYPTQNDYFRNNNVHFCLYFLQYGYKSKTKRINQNTITCEDIVGKANIRFNNKPLGGGIFNAQHLARGENFQTNFVEVPKNDILNLLLDCKRSNYFKRLKGKYYAPSANLDTEPSSTLNNTLYFKGVGTSDCIYMLYENNLI